MKAKDVEKLTTDELKRKIKNHKMAVIVYIAIVAIMIAISMVRYLEVGYDFSVLMPLFFLPMVMIFYGTQKKLEKELKKRNAI